MDKVEYHQKLDELTALVQAEDYDRALTLADEIDWRRVKSIRTLNMVADIYEKNKDYESEKEILKIAYSRSSIGRSILSRLVEVNLRLGDVQSAERYFKDFSGIAQGDNSKCVLQYKIYKAKKAPLEAQIAVLEEYREREYTERWAYELAILYSRAGMPDKCVEACDDMILWFSEGKYVLKAMELKMKYQPLSASQQVLYEKEKSNYQKSSQPLVGKAAAKIAATRKLSQAGPLPATPGLTETPAAPAGGEERGQSPARADMDESLKEAAAGFAAAIGSVKAAVSRPEAEEAAEPAKTWEEQEDDVFEAADQPVDHIRILDPTTEIDLGMNGIDPVALDLEAEAAAPVFESAAPETEEEAGDRAGEETPEAEPAPSPAKPMTPARESAVRKSFGERSNELRDRLARGIKDVFGGIADRAEEVLAGDEGLAGEESADLEVRELETNTASIPALHEDGILKVEVMDQKALPEEKAEPSPSEKTEGVEFDLNAFLAETAGSFSDELAAGGYGTETEGPEEGESAAESVEAFRAGLDALIAEKGPETGGTGRLPHYNEELEIPDPEPTEEEKKSRTIPLSQIGQNTVPISLDQVLLEETPEERRIRILNKKNPTRMSEEQRQIFTYFARIPGMDTQILEAMSGVYAHAGEKTSRHGNIAVMGAKGTGKTRLTEGLIIAMCRDMGMDAAKIARISGIEMNRRDPAQTVSQMAGGFLVIENAGRMESETVEKLSKAMDFRTDCMVLIIEDEKSAMRNFLRSNPQFASRFEKVISIPVFTNDELVTFARTYATENGYKIDDLGILALYTRIGNNQTEEEPVTISQVKEMVDSAIEHAVRSRRRPRKDKKKEKWLMLQEKDFEA